MKTPFWHRPKWVVLASVMLLVTFSGVSSAQDQAPADFSHLTYKAPPNWKSWQVSNWTILSATDLPAGQIGQIGISPGGETTRSLGDEFSALIAASQGSYTTLESQPSKTATDPQGLPTIQQTLVLQDPSGNKLVRLYVGKKNGTRFEALTLTASPEAVAETVAAFKIFYSSISYDPSPGGAAAPPVGAAPGVQPPQAPGTETGIQTSAATLPISSPSVGGTAFSVPWPSFSVNAT